MTLEKFTPLIITGLESVIICILKVKLSQRVTRQAAAATKPLIARGKFRKFGGSLVSITKACGRNGEVEMAFGTEISGRSRISEVGRNSEVQIY